MDVEDRFNPSLSSLSSVLGRLTIDSFHLVNKDIKEYFVRANSDDAEEWLKRPDVPSPEEIMGTLDTTDDEYVELAPNSVVGPWQSKDAYLKTHYELLREDTIAPLRDAVAYVREDPKMMDSKAVSIYDKVCSLGCSLFTSLTVYSITLGLLHGYHVRTKRPGSSNPIFNQSVGKEYSVGIHQASCQWLYCCPEPSRRWIPQELRDCNCCCQAARRRPAASARD